MKLKGIFGKGSGKLGNAVFAVSGGEQLVKEYNPRVANPNTPAQVEQRAKLKLASQLAAVFANVLGFTKSGLTSARNKFVAANIKNITYAGENASIDLSQIDLSGGSVVLPIVQVSYMQGTGFAVLLASGAPANVGAVVYVLVKQAADQKLEVLGYKVTTNAGADRTFGTAIEGTSQEVYAYAYGIISNGQSLNVSYDDYFAEVNSENAQLDVVKAMLAKGSGTTITTSTLFTP